MNELIQANGSMVPDDRIQRLMRDFLAGRRATTLRAYQQALEHFRIFDGASSTTEAIGRLLLMGPGEANALVLAYRNGLIEQALSPATVNLRLSALRAVTKLGRTCGIVTWSLEVQGMRSTAYRDVRGPGENGFRRLLDELAGQDGALARRNCAILRLAHDLALRRNEIVSLDYPVDVELEGKRLQVMGKGDSQGLWLTMPRPTIEALEAWILVRGSHSGPLFCRMDRAGHGEGRLSGESLRLLLKRLGMRTGIRTKPHGLRHSAITTALDRTAGDVRRVRVFSRHKNIETLMRYDDARQDFGGEIAKIVAGE